MRQCSHSRPQRWLAAWKLSRTRSNCKLQERWQRTHSSAVQWQHRPSSLAHWQHRPSSVAPLPFRRSCKGRQRQLGWFSPGNLRDMPHWLRWSQQGRRMHRSICMCTAVVQPGHRRRLWDRRQRRPWDRQRPRRQSLLRVSRRRCCGCGAGGVCSGGLIVRIHHCQSSARSIAVR